MTHAELDQIAARRADLTIEVDGVISRTASKVSLSLVERDALLSLAREGLQAREQAARDARNAENDVKQAMELLDEANRMLTHCPTCGEFRGHGHVCMTPPTSGPDGTKV